MHRLHLNSLSLCAAFALLGSISNAAWAQNGLLGEYYNSGGGASPQPPPGSPAGTTSTAVPIVTRIDANIDFVFPNPPAVGVPTDGFMVSWRGSLTITTAGDYTFVLRIDDGGRLFIDGIQVPMTNAAMATDPWVDQGTTDWTGILVGLTAAVHAIRVEYYDNAGTQDEARLLYSGPDNGNVLAVVPTGVLTPPPPPPVPTVTAVQGAGGAAVVNVAWTNSGAGVTYDLQRSVAGGAFASLGTGLTTLVFQDLTVSFGPNFCYQVRAVQGPLMSAFSASSCVTLIPPPPRTNDHGEGLFGDNCACGSTASRHRLALPTFLAALVLLALGRRR